MYIPKEYWCLGRSPTLSKKKYLPLGLEDFLEMAELIAGIPEAATIYEFSPAGYEPSISTHAEEGDKAYEVLEEGKTVSCSYSELRGIAKGYKRANWIDVSLSYPGSERSLVIQADDSSMWRVSGDPDWAELLAQESVRYSGGELRLYGKRERVYPEESDRD
jgi:hypothetical protein